MRKRFSFKFLGDNYMQPKKGWRMAWLKHAGQNNKNGAPSLNKSQNKENTFRHDRR